MIRCDFCGIKKQFCSLVYQNRWVDIGKCICLDCIRKKEEKL